MPAAVRIVLNRNGLGAILRGSEGRLRADLDRRGAAMVRAAGTNYEAEGYVGQTRYRVTVGSRGRGDHRSVLLAALDAARR
jgi:hypothetical protein